MKNLCWHVEGKILRGGCPKSIADLKKLWDMGVRKIISLETGFADRLGDYPDERAHWLDMGGEFISVQCSNFWPPSKSEELKVVSEMIGDFVVYIHCFSGVDRTGWMCAAHMWSVCVKRLGCGWLAWREWAWRKGTHWWFFWWAPVFAWRHRK